MLNIIILIIIFIMGIYFGSFYTLATYRLPKGENITHVHSYCPSCKHKLGLLDLVPVLSYIFLGARCRYCKKPIGNRYFLFEIFTGIVFVLYAISLKLNVYTLTLSDMIYFLIVSLYFSGLFILAGIEKERGTIQKSVLIYSTIVSIIYMVYSYTLNMQNVYEYAIYLVSIIILFFMDTILLKKKIKVSYIIQNLILIVNMFMFCGIRIVCYTIAFTILAIGFKNILVYLKNKKSKILKQKIKTKYMFFLCVSNIIVIIIFNFILNYIII